VAIDPYQQVIVLGADTLQRLDNASGNVIWVNPLESGQQYAPSDDFDRGLAIGPTGDIFVVGGTTSVGDSLTISRLSGVTGATLWGRRADKAGGALYPKRLATDASSNIVVAGGTSGGFFVAKVAGTTGEELWRYELAPPGPNVSFAVATDASGN